MKAKIGIIIEKLTSNFWMIPSGIAVILTALVFVLKSQVIVSYDPVIKEVFFLRAETEAVQLLLSSIATSIMTVLGVVFSVIVVVMAQMSSQHSPRVVSNFTRSTVAQVVLGFYVGTFTYCLILLMNSRRGGQDNEAVAIIAVAGAFFLSLICLLLLIIYIHHVTQSIQSTSIITQIAKETIHSLRNTSSDRRENSKAQNFEKEKFKRLLIIESTVVGYIDFIDWNKLPKHIHLPKWHIQFHVKSGDFVQNGEALLTIFHDEPCEGLEKTLRGIFAISQDRTFSQDFEFGLQKLKDIALRALSPGINDPSTAIESIHAITSVMLEFQKHPDFNKNVILDAHKKISFVEINFNQTVKKIFDHIANFSTDHPDVKLILRRNLELIRKAT